MAYGRGMVALRAEPKLSFCSNAAAVPADWYPFVGRQLQCLQIGKMSSLTSDPLL